MYEYIFHATVFGNDSIIENIKQLNNKKIIQLIPKFKQINKTFIKIYAEFKKYDKFDEIIEHVYKNLNEYFTIISKNYNNFSLGLTSGFDSRLTLALLLNCNIKPIIYTGGNDSIDVDISRKICKKFDLEFKNYYENEDFQYDKTTFEEILKNKFILDDGFNYFGIFFSVLNNDLDLSSFIKTYLSGMGGEIYRNRWQLMDRKIDINDFIRIKWKNYLDIPTSEFNALDYYKIFSEKIINDSDLEVKNSKLNPIQINLIYPSFSLRYWAGRTISKINQFCYCLLPYSEPKLYFQSIYIPIKYKIAGKFEAALIKRINPEIAKFQSNRGFNFYDGPNFKAKISEFQRMYMPAKIRYLIHLIKEKRNLELSQLDYIKEREKLIFNKEIFMQKYVNIDKIFTPEMYSRVLTLEYFFQNYM